MEFYKTGKIINTHGLKGLIRIDYYHYQPEKLMEVSSIYIGNEKIKYPIKSITANKKILLNLEGIDSIEKAEKLKNSDIFINLEEKEILIEDKDEYFIEDIIGLRVYDEEDNYIGKITNILKTGKNDIYELDNDVKKLIPASKQFIKEIDLKNNKMIVKLIEGLIE
ncbi:MAG: ribosome maturation factor RimM [Bacillota bacterium]|nr:ribosome maturation factor RimM [Bacillota bacterium]